MRRVGLALVAVALAGCGVAGPSALEAGPAGAGILALDSPSLTQVPNEVIVGTTLGATRQTLAAIAAVGGQVSSTIQLAHTEEIVQLPTGADAKQAIAQLSRAPGVAFVQPNLVYRIALDHVNPTFPAVLSSLSAFAPDDPYFGKQWAYSKTQTPNNWAGIDAGNTLVAITDTGIDATHPDLAGRIRPGYDFADGTSDTTDRVGHGTHCAGILGATGNNGVGMAGVTWNAPILAVKVMNDAGQGTDESVVEGMKFAVDQGARVVSMSLGAATTSIDPVMHDALSYCLGKGALVVVAAGNSGGAIESPANDPLAVAVTSTSNYPLVGERSSYFSSRGPQAFISAPGDGIWSTLPMAGSRMGTEYGSASGTSMATPFVAGAATLIFAQHPDYTPAEVRAKLQQSVDDLGSPGWDPDYGWGRINLAKATQ
ncbi:MAG: S8 family serine peptidase [Cyanobacteria bacterium REEB65]|nr:S8 family serine peptidase [Cyanobacteria bacterium REEB65]